MISLVRSFIILVLLATNSPAQTSPLEQLLQQQSQGLPLGSDMQSIENMFSGQGFDINPENARRTAKQPVIPNEQNVRLLDRRLTARSPTARARGASAVE